MSRAKLQIDFQLRIDIWRHKYVTSWRRLLIGVCIVREDQYLSIDTKIKFVRALAALDAGEGQRLFLNIYYITLVYNQDIFCTTGKTLVLQISL